MVKSKNQKVRRTQYACRMPHCKECADFFIYRGKARRKSCILILLTLGISVIGAVALMFELKLSKMIFAYAGIFFVIVTMILTMRYFAKIANLPLRTGQIRKGDVIKLQRVGKRAFSSKSDVDISFLNPKYAKLFIEANQVSEPKYNEHALKMALDQLELRGPV